MHQKKRKMNLKKKEKLKKKTMDSRQTNKKWGEFKKKCMEHGYRWMG